MSAPTCTAPGCDRPTTVGFLCRTCHDTLRHDLDAVPDLLIDLTITIARQDRLADTAGRATSDRPLPLRLGPLEARRDLHDTLTAWAHHVADRRGTTRPVDHTAETAAWLSRHVGDIQDDPAAGQIADEIGYIVITAQRAVDKPLQLAYAGPCDLCGGDLYAHPRAAEVTCRNEPCRTSYNMHQRREWLLSQAEHQLLTATEMSRALPGLLPRDPDGRQPALTAAMIRGYAHRGRLAKHPPHPNRPHEPLYLVREVMNLLSALHRKDGAHPPPHALAAP